MTQGTGLMSVGDVKSAEKSEDGEIRSKAAQGAHESSPMDMQKAVERGQVDLGDDQFLVNFEPDEKEDPRNFSPWHKAFLTVLLGMLALVGSVGSAIVSPANRAIADEFALAIEVAILDVSLFVLGFALGPCLWAPISEVYGRRMSILPAVFFLGIFSIATATSQNAAAILVTRFFAGVFASAPICNVAATLGDIYEPSARGVAITFYALFVDSGPALGPVIGAAITVNPYLGWRWTEYIEAIWVMVIFVLGLFFLPEVYHPVLLKRKAERLRKETGDSRYWHPHEKEKIKLSNVLTKYLSRPVRMLFTEPMVTAIATYASFVYALLYVTLEVFPIVYQEIRHWSLLTSTLPYLALVIGFFLVIVVNIANQPMYARAVQRNDGRAVPEARLPPMIIGGWLLVAGLFWFAWTSNADFHWAIPTASIILTGAGFNIVFQQCINFLVDTYSLYAASAISANTILRSFMAAGLPLAVKPMIRNLGVGGGVSVLGAIGALLLPVPWLFMKYGAKLRSMSRFAPND